MGGRERGARKPGGREGGRERVNRPALELRALFMLHNLLVACVEEVFPLHCELARRTADHPTELLLQVVVLVLEVSLVLRNRRALGSQLGFVIVIVLFLLLFCHLLFRSTTSFGFVSLLDAY